ncbi:MAG: pyruvate kinase, partial [Thermoleophilia bacterium]|nr:pyruvate kinase [Thermoleophilia bacterium]
MDFHAKSTRRIRHTKIVCTIGPATSDPGVLRAMVEAGMNVARLNFSHGTHEQHARVVSALRDIGRELRRPMAIIADLQGPKIRLGELHGVRQLVDGTQLKLLTRDLPSPDDLLNDELPVRLPQLSDAVSAGSLIMVDDGSIRLSVDSSDTETGIITCTVVVGGPVSSHKGVNLPDVHFDTPSLTAKDLEDLAFAMDQEVDYVAESFVRSPDDVEQLRVLIANHPATHKPQVIAKIETRLAVDRLDDVLAASDAVMVARGDLGVELGAAEVPLVQKRMIKRANELGIPVITATQMLESMISSPEPTRAEASDVANAILDGTSAVMLSGE